VWLLLHTVFAGEPRYHVPIMPVIVVLATATIMRASGALLPDAAQRANEGAPPLDARGEAAGSEPRTTA
jgi:hypothetical protein